MNQEKRLLAALSVKRREDVVDFHARNVRGVATTIRSVGFGFIFCLVLSIAPALANPTPEGGIMPADGTVASSRDDATPNMSRGQPSEDDNRITAFRDKVGAERTAEIGSVSQRLDGTIVLAAGKGKRGNDRAGRDRALTITLKEHANA